MTTRAFRQEGGQPSAKEQADFRAGEEHMAAVLARGQRPTGQGPLAMSKDTTAPAMEARPKDHARPRLTAPGRPPGMPATFEADRAKDASTDLQTTKGKK
jgi:hypothetical protein